MIEVRLTGLFHEWMIGLADGEGRSRIVARLRRFEIGNLGDVKPVGDGVSEARIHHGPGYRLYFVQRGKVLIVMLCGGDKSTQKSDIQAARSMARTIP